MNKIWRINKHQLGRDLAIGSAVILACILLGLLVASPARADVGVQPILPGGSNIKPGDETPIQMTAEKVIMTIRQGTDADHAAYRLKPWEGEGYISFPIIMQEPYYPILYLAVVDVVAEFSMKNPTSEEVSLTVWFPLASTLDDVRWEGHSGEAAPRVENFKVSVEDEPLEYTVAELPNPQGEDKPVLPWASFPVVFPAGKEVKIQVEYVFLPQPGINLLDMTLSYIFQTGADWAGPIGKAELLLNLPYPASPETIGFMPEGAHAEGQQVSWTWENFEPVPQDDFSILLLRPERWEELQYSRGIVKNNPDFAQGWLFLATLYERFSQGIVEHGQILQYFGETYQQLGVQAAREAARLDPNAVEPHYELALLYASALPTNSSPEELQPVWDELAIMKELNPEQAQALEPNVYDILYWALYNDATATAEAAAWSEQLQYNDATATADAISAECWNTFGLFCEDATATAEALIQPEAVISTPEPSATPLSSSTSPPQLTTIPATSASRSTILSISLVVALVILIAVGVIIIIKRR